MKLKKMAFAAVIGVVVGVILEPPLKRLADRFAHRPDDHKVPPNKPAPAPAPAPLEDS